jgi:hypothetical protein
LLRVATDSERDPIAGNLLRHFAAARESFGQRLPEDWEDPALRAVIDPLLDATRAVVTARKLSIDEVVSPQVPEHSFAVFRFRQDESPLGSVARRYNERFGGKLGFDPATLALSHAETIHSHSGFVSVSCDELLLGRPLSSTHHELYHAASDHHLSLGHTSPDAFSFRARSENTLFSAFGQLPGSEVFAPLYGGIKALEELRSCEDPHLSRFILRDAGASFGEAISCSAAMKAGVKNGILGTVSELHAAAAAGLLVVDRSEFETEGKITLRVPFRWGSQTETGAPEITLFTKASEEEPNIRIVRLKGNDQSWSIVCSMPAATVSDNLTALAQEIKVNENINASEVLQTKAIQGVIQTIKDDARAFLRTLIEAESLANDLRDITLKALSGTAPNQRELDEIMQDARSLFPAVQQALQ